MITTVTAADLRVRDQVMTSAGEHHFVVQNVRRPSKSDTVRIGACQGGRYSTFFASADALFAVDR